MRASGASVQHQMAVPGAAGALHWTSGLRPGELGKSCMDSFLLSMRMPLQRCG